MMTADTTTTPTPRATGSTSGGYGTPPWKTSPTPRPFPGRPRLRPSLSQHTRSDHLLLVARYLGWKSAPAGGGEMKELEQFLLDRAMEHDSPTLLFSLATEFLMSTKTIRPGVSVLERMITSARTGATGADARSWWATC